MSERRVSLKSLRPWIVAAVLALAALLVYDALRPYSAEEIVESVRAITPGQIAVGLVFTAASFIALSLSDTLAVRYAGSSLAYPRIALVSFISVSIGHVLGFAVLSSGALRHRFYTRWGMTHGDVARVLVFCGLTVALGILTLGGLASVLRPALLADLFALAEPVVVGVGCALLGAAAVYAALAGVAGERVLRIRAFALPVPPLRLALGQIAVGTADMLLVSAVLYQMLAGENVQYPAIAAAYVTANLASIVTHVPGGLGVIEAVVVSLVPGAHVVGALIAFRALYYLLPFVLGCLTLAVTELLQRHGHAARGSVTVPPERPGFPAEESPFRRRGGSPR